MKSVGEIAAENPAAIPIFERLQIDYCCGGKTPLRDACASVGITTDEFFATLNAAPAAPEQGLDWSGRTITELQTYLVDRFHAHAREELDALNLLAAKVLGVHGSRRPEFARVAQLVKALTDDMLPHMMKEELVLFPYVASVESGEPKACCFGSVENPVRMMMIEHEAVGDLLSALRTTTSDFAPPEDACFSYRELYRRLGAFEAETHEHIHLENNIHFPRAIELERSALTPSL